MKINTILILFLLTLFISCNNRNEYSLNYSLRDAVTQEHLQLLDSSYYGDTTDINYKVLKAYISNDTFFFKNLHLEIGKKNKFKQQYENNDSCIHQPKLSELNATEVYRFVYTAPFCNYKLNVTVSNGENGPNIHFIIFQDVWLNTACKVLNEYDKKISSKNWDDISELMKKADYWGLKSTNGVQGLDVSTLIVTGYTDGNRTLERIPKTNYVCRWGYSTLSDPFHLILKLSENKEGCLVIK